MLRITHEEKKSKRTGNTVLSIDKEEQPETRQCKDAQQAKNDTSKSTNEKEAKQKYR
jgi:hypothetical protein